MHSLYQQEGDGLTVVCLVRHGETQWNKLKKTQGREDIELNRNGIAQASKCAEFLKAAQWDAIVTSPLKRAKTTAQIISGYLGIAKIDEIYDFIERDYGKASGTTPQERSELFAEGVIEGEEDWNRLKDRAMKALEAVVNRYEGKRVIVVSHKGVINSILSEISHGAIGAGKTVLANGCINILKHNGNKWSIELYNQTVSQNL
jgi:uncharacterized phosphatase